ncbi:hypothetical protein HDU84_004729 [Entophlyctis sp. JEL0112]|nr:hypothetical protein HDU84_004729 [Entophlyctis sp. JEL0112]
MYSANVKTKMTVKEFITNTMNFVDSTLQSNQNLSQNVDESWRREMETVLKGMYSAVKLEAILIPQGPMSPLNNSLDGGISSNPYFRNPSTQFSLFSPDTRRSIGSENSSNSNQSQQGPNRSASAAEIETRGGGVSLEGLLIRKKLQSAAGARAQTRSWIPMWAVLAVAVGRAVELDLFEIEERNSVDSGDVWGAYANLDAARVKVPAGRAPEVLTLLHSHAKALPSPGYNQMRPFVFYLCLSDGTVLLFQTQTNYDMHRWTDTLNFWAARYSMGPMRGGGMGNTEYGWSEFEWEQMHRNSDGQANGIGSSSNTRALSASFWRRVDPWEAPRSSTIVVSSLEMTDQLDMLQNQFVQILGEFDKHASYRPLIERKYMLNPISKNRALSNWSKKMGYLEEEREKYNMYIKVLQGRLKGVGSNGYAINRDPSAATNTIASVAAAVRTGSMNSGES